MRRSVTSYRKIFYLVILLVYTIMPTFGGHKIAKVIPGADQTQEYLPLLCGKRVALVVNQTSRVGSQHLVDFLLGNRINVKRIFAPEHGFRGEAGAGEQIDNSNDKATGISIISIYGNNKKPTTNQLSDIDIVVFDIQDVGCRFYTYISTLHYMMEACAENNKTLLILDRPNPNGDYIDGPVLQSKFSSFVGMDPIPIVHGCTIGELALMINGEKWLTNGVKATLEIIKVANYTHSTKYDPPVKPSPNLPNYLSIRLYPSLCLFEATSVSVGRGTLFPFQVLGYPDSTFGKFFFTPQSLKGMELNPLQEDKKCYGDDFRDLQEPPNFTLSFFINWYNKFTDKEKFLTRHNWFNLLTGNSQVLELIVQGNNEERIRRSWQTELAEYQNIRKKYLLYQDFNTIK